MNDLGIKKIIWMMDETIAHSHPRDWQRVRQREEDLINIIGNPAFQHEIADPLLCLDRLVSELKDRDFSCIFDLTGWLTPVAQELFPNTPVNSCFSLSRVRTVSSPRLETAGYKITMSPKEIEEEMKTLDLSRPLIIDDVSFTGWTSKKTMELWGMEPESVTHAFLIANTGNLAPGVDGAVSMLQKLGSSVHFGKKLHTPQEDGWHLKDLHTHPHIDQAFILSLLFQEIVIKEGIESKTVQRFFTHDTVMNVLFPERFTSADIGQLLNDGRFVLKSNEVFSGEEIHARNPFLWASPYFQEHVDVQQMLTNKNDIVEILSELRQLTSDPEARTEAGLELRRHVRDSIQSSKEGRFSHGKERL